MKKRVRCAPLGDRNRRRAGERQHAAPEQIMLIISVLDPP
jgi:hypothetical protein